MCSIFYGIGTNKKGTERMSGRDTIDVPWSRFMFRNLGLQVQTNTCWMDCKEEHC